MQSPKPTDLPQHIHQIVSCLEKENYSVQVVGGAVRDLLLGQKPKDFDLVTSARPEQIKRLFKRCFLIGRRFRLALIHSGRHVTEVATYRREGEEQHSRACPNSGRVLRDNVYGTLQTDVLRRDFTVNAIYYSPSQGQLIDPLDGLEDIKLGLVRMIGKDIDQRMREDPLRALRAVRISGHNHISIESKLKNILPSTRPLLDAIPRARIGLEINKIFSSTRALNIFTLLGDYQLLDALLPTSICQIFTESDHPIYRLLSAAQDQLNHSAPKAPFDQSLPLPVGYSEALRYASLYLPLFLQSCRNIRSTDDVQQAVQETNSQMVCPTQRRTRDFNLSLWRALPRLFILKKSRMCRFAKHHVFVPTYTLYYTAAQAGVLTDSLIGDWQDFFASREDRECLQTNLRLHPWVYVAENRSSAKPATRRRIRGGQRRGRRSAKS